LHVGRPKKSRDKSFERRKRRTNAEMLAGAEAAAEEGEEVVDDTDRTERLQSELPVKDRRNSKTRRKVAKVAAAAKQKPIQPKPKPAATKRKSSTQPKSAPKKQSVAKKKSATQKKSASKRKFNAAATSATGGSMGAVVGRAKRHRQ